MILKNSGFKNIHFDDFGGALGNLYDQFFQSCARLYRLSYWKFSLVYF